MDITWLDHSTFQFVLTRGETLILSIPGQPRLKLQDSVRMGRDPLANVPAIPHPRVGDNPSTWIDAVDRYTAMPYSKA
jgi:hypothetical protein